MTTEQKNNTGQDKFSRAFEKDYKVNLYLLLLVLILAACTIISGGALIPVVCLAIASCFAAGKYFLFLTQLSIFPSEDRVFASEQEDKNERANSQSLSNSSHLASTSIPQSSFFKTEDKTQTPGAPIENPTTKNISQSEINPKSSFSPTGPNNHEMKIISLIEKSSLCELTGPVKVQKIEAGAKIKLTDGFLQCETPIPDNVEITIQESKSSSHTHVARVSSNNHVVTVSSSNNHVVNSGSLIITGDYCIGGGSIWVNGSTVSEKKLEDQRRGLEAPGLGKNVRVICDSGNISINGNIGESSNIQMTSGKIQAGDLGPNVTIELSSGDIDVKSVGNQSRLKIVSGEIQAGDLESNVTIESSSGDIEVKRVGNRSSLKTISGDLKAGDLDSEVILQSSSGDIEVKRVGNRSSLKTISGDITHGPLSSGVTVRTISGDTTGNTTRQSCLFRFPDKEDEGNRQAARFS